MKARRRFVDWRPEEVAATLWAAGTFFCVMTSYAMLRPVRDAIGALAPETLTRKFLYTFLGTLLLHPLFAAAATRVVRAALVATVYRACALIYLLLWAGLSWGSEAVQRMFADAYFVWVTVFVLYAVSTFWSLMADSFEPARAARLFGFLAAGGTLGMMTGARVTIELSARIGALWLLPIAAVGLECAVRCARRVAARTPPRVAPAIHEPPSGIWEGIRLVATSRYLLWICGYLLLYTATSTHLYYAQAAIVKAADLGRDQASAYYAQCNFYENLLTAALQLTIASRFVHWLGVTLCLLSVPLVTLLACGAVALEPTLLLAGCIAVVRRGTHFAVAKPAQELLFTIVGRDAKYKAKSCIDCVVYRGGDSLAGALHDLVLHKAGFAAAVLIAAPLSVLWGASAGVLGRLWRRCLPLTSAAPPRGPRAAVR
jgi:AAA family ATP:ADP antiporter